MLRERRLVSRCSRRGELRRAAEGVRPQTSRFHWFDAGHGSMVVDQAIEHHELMLTFAGRISAASEKVRASPVKRGEEGHDA